MFNTSHPHNLFSILLGFKIYESGNRIQETSFEKGTEPIPVVSSIIWFKCGVCVCVQGWGEGVRMKTQLPCGPS